MTNEFEYLMQLMGAASTGREAAPPAGELNWDTLFVLANQQQILPLICHAVRKNPPPNCPNVFPLVLTSCARRGAMIALLEEMHNAGIPCCVLKGFAAASNYAAPEYRISGDTDILIDPADEERACVFLENRGFSVKRRRKNGHHSTATHPEMGLLEVHVQFCGKLVKETWLDTIEVGNLLREPKQQVTSADGTFWTLGPTDHLVYMALHLIKHFISLGMSLRTMMDVALAIAKQRDQLDMERFWSTLNSLNYGTLMSAILWAMVRYCGFLPEEFPGLGSCDDVQVQLILDDLEKGGWLGQTTKEERKSGWYEYNRQFMKKKKSKLQYHIYLLKWLYSIGVSILFPGQDQLSRRYPFLVKYPFLIPFAWLHRLLFRGLPVLLGKVRRKMIVQNDSEISPEGRSRIAMFRSLDML